MKVNKKIISNITKCYAISPLRFKEKEHVLVSAERIGRCILFDMDGNEIDTVWSDRGGVMTMGQVPGSDGQFLAIHQFFSPNESKEAKIVIVTPVAKGNWEIRTLVELPFVHRFDIVNRNGINYLIACALKSGHEENWSMPGRVFAAVLPKDLSNYNENNQLELKVIKEGLLKNHGYYHLKEDGLNKSIISADNGVFVFTPPEAADGEWEIKQLIDSPASDAVLLDLNEDGEKELLVLSPFHGDTITIYKKNAEKYVKVYESDPPVPFLHAIYAGIICGKPSVVIGHREGNKNLMVYTYNQEEKKYQAEVIDQNCGPANVCYFKKDGKDVILSTNREIDEVAMYTLEP